MKIEFNLIKKWYTTEFLIVFLGRRLGPQKMARKRFSLHTSLN